MFDFFKKLLPKEEKFFDLFEAHAAKAVAAAASLRAIVEGGKTITANCKNLMAHEVEYQQRFIRSAMAATTRKKPRALFRCCCSLMVCMQNLRCQHG